MRIVCCMRIVCLAIYAQHIICNIYCTACNYIQYIILIMLCIGYNIWYVVEYNLKIYTYIWLDIKSLVIYIYIYIYGFQISATLESSRRSLATECWASPQESDQYVRGGANAEMIKCGWSGNHTLRTTIYIILCTCHNHLTVEVLL